MLFSSISFFYYFFAIVLAIYFIVPFKIKLFGIKRKGEYLYFEAKNFVLLMASLFFYFYGEPIYTFLMIGTILVNYIAGILIDKFRGRFLSKLFLWISVALSLGSLGFFKYSDFFISNVNNIFKSEISLLGLALPIGISFYTFQILSYTVDVYRGDAKVQKSIIRLATYVALFPQLIAGPIVRYTTVEEELSDRKHSLENFSYGVTRFVIGLSKKVLIADTLGGFIRAFRASDDISVAFYWFFGIAVCLQLYFDFSGYSDMAIGLGRIFGFKFLENFNYPFISKTVSEFWRRWHMSLGSWFRDYVYIPLGGNKVPLGRWFFNVLAVWFLTGFWHGADWTFIVWGLYFAFFLLIEKLFLAKLLSKIPRVFSHLYVVLVILVSFVIFHGDGMTGAITDVASLFGAGSLPLWSADTAYYISSYAFVFIFALVGATPVVKNAVLKIKSYKTGNAIVNVIEPVFVVVMLLIVTAYFVDGSFSPFLYFRF